MNLRQTVVENDLRILDVATYVASKGSMINIRGLKESPDKLNKFQDDVTNIFKDFKQRIRSGKFTLLELEEREYSKWGITEEVPMITPAGLEDIFSKAAEKLKRENDEYPETDNKLGF